MDAYNSYQWQFIYMHPLHVELIGMEEHHYHIN